MFLHDIVILGTAVPSILKDGRKTICMAGWHEDIGLLRAYPCNVRMGLHRWDKITLDLERTGSDSRNESWKIKGSENWKELTIKSRNGSVPPGKDRQRIINSCIAPCVQNLNKDRLSLGIIIPEIHDIGLRDNPTCLKKETATDHFGEKWLHTKRDFPKAPYIKFRCGEQCKAANYHTHTLLDWGAYELMRKYPGREDKEWWASALHLDKPNRYLLVGNQCHRRTSYITICILTPGKSQ